MMLTFCGVYPFDMNCSRIPSRLSDDVWFNSYSIVNSPKFGEYSTPTWVMYIKKRNIINITVNISFLRA